MAIARIVFQSRTRGYSAALNSHYRHHSSKTHPAQLIEIDLESSSASPADSMETAVDGITAGIKKLEEAIHTIIVRRAAPDWLPFLPGHSYWVPPRSTSMRSHSASNMIEVLGKLASIQAARNPKSQGEPFPDEEQMSLASGKGWPSSAFFIKGTSPMHPISAVEVRVNIQVDEDNEDDTSSSDDDDDEG